MSRGILYMVWGEGYADSLRRSIASVKHWHPELEYHIAEMPAGSNLLCKSQMFDLTPFTETLFLDADTTVLGNLDYGFLKARQHGISLCINANPWNRRYESLPQHRDEVEYSSGVVFFDKSWSIEVPHQFYRSTKMVFDQWRATDQAGTSCRYFDGETVKVQQHNDQATLTLAMQAMGFNPFVLPLNWNLYPKWQKHFWGPVKIWHGYDDIPQSLLKWNGEQSKRESVIRFASLP